MPYTSVGGRYRPYLEVIFSNESTKKSSNKTFAMLDSGADHTVIPYSLGVLMELEQPTEEERLNLVCGVGGNLSYIERKCKIYINNPSKKEIYGFDETVWWIYPNETTKKEQEDLIQNFKNYQGLQAQCIKDTELYSHFGEKIQETIDSLNLISGRLEVEVLLGRCFFNNFEFIQFCHKDRIKEEKCFFNYKVDSKKVIQNLVYQK